MEGENGNQVSIEAVTEALRNVGVPDDHIQSTVEHYTNVSSGNGNSNAAAPDPSGQGGDDDTPLTRSMLADALTPHLEKVADTVFKRAQGIFDSNITRISNTVNQRVGALERAREEDLLKTLPADQQIAKRVERLESIGQPQKTQAGSPQAGIFTPEQLLNHVKSLGVDVNDKRLDWGVGETTFNSGYGKLLSSIKKIHEEDTAAQIKKAQATVEAELKKKSGEGRPSGGSGSSNPQRDAIVKAYIENPDDPNAYKAYKKLREDEGLPTR